MYRMTPNRRTILRFGLAAFAAAAGVRPVLAATQALHFGELYGKISSLGLEFSDKVKALNGQDVSMKGFMAPPLKAESDFFVLTEIPMALCPFCSSDADWPDNIVVIYLNHRQTFAQANGPITVEGTLEVGSSVDPSTGFVSRLRLRGASFSSA